MTKFTLAIILFASFVAPASGQIELGGGRQLGGGHDLVQICPVGTVASYISTIKMCEQPPAVMVFTGYSCTSTPSSICTNLGVNGANINMLLDPNGGHTLLFAAVGEAWDVTAGQTVHVTVTGKLWGSTKNSTYPHWTIAGQTNDGTEENKVTVACGAFCSGDGRNGISDIVCDAAHTAGIECNEQGTDVYIAPYGAQYTVAPANAPYTFTIELIMNGNTGTATLKSMGIHLS